MPLTDIKIKQAKPREKLYKLSDGGGLQVHIQTSGAKYWRLAYRYSTKQKTLALGVYPELSLAEAREKRAKARKLLDNGIDPANEMSKRSRKHRETNDIENSFDNIAREWFDMQKENWSPKYASRVISSFEKDVFPYIGNYPIEKITAPLVLNILRKIEKRNALEVAARVLRRCHAVCRYAIQTGRAEHNPVSDLQGALKTRKVKHRAALSLAELPDFLKRLEKYDGNKLTMLALKLIVHTFVRSGELRGARWSEIDFEQAEWRIPAERMKMRTPHIVPLSLQSIAILKQIHEISGHRELVLPSERNWKKTISENTLIYAMYRMGYHTRATVHGFRATASTILNEKGFNPDVIERQLAHMQRNKVRAAYHRSEYLDDRKTLMQWWSDFIDSQYGNKIILGRFGNA
ncbi:MAG: integrase [endosymbiont of Galathealinum brachiosum]|uniref:Integrase n=1 Tax=endosymbiont of Galathealinum brachiosum TaxID=2200906 RepID=A0A370DIV3_9GAMM|nr:MAG: integrase [endosymbiont of Galathealinum brachiosum]